MNTVTGVGKNEPTVVNESGGKQSRVLYRFDLLDPQAMFKMTEVLREGAEKYGDNNWRNISVRDHLNHLIIHAYAYLIGDTSDDHLSHIMCRAMFAQAVDIDDKNIVSVVDDGITTCVICRQPTIPRKEGVHWCTQCGTGHDIKTDKTPGGSVQYYIHPVKDGGSSWI